jgi:vacuolar-type H+-ATPase subunit F/Vma7
MQIAVVGSHDFTLGFQLAGVLKLYNPKNLEEMTKTMKSLLNEKEVGVIVKDCERNYRRALRPQFWALGQKRIIPSESLSSRH